MEKFPTTRICMDRVDFAHLAIAIRGAIVRGVIKLPESLTFNRSPGTLLFNLTQATIWLVIPKRQPRPSQVYPE